MKYPIPLRLFPVLILLFGSAKADDWPCWRGPNGNGIFSESGWNPKALESGANILWKINVGEGYSSVSVTNARLNTMGNIDNEDIVYCLEAETGKEVWRFAYDCPTNGFKGPFATPVIDNGCVYTLSRNGDLYCLDAGTGDEKWHADITREFGAVKPKYGFSGSPVICDDLLVLNACKNGLAINKLTGEKAWASSSKRCGYATPVLYTYHGRKCAAIFAHQSINGVEVKTGKLLWSFPWVFDDGACSADPVVVGSRVFISSAYRNGGTMIEFTDNVPKQHWYKKDIQDEFGSSIYIDGYLYVPHGDTRHRTSYLKCIDFNSGEEMWCRDTGHCSLIHGNGKFIVLNQWGELLIMEASEKGCKDISKAKVLQTSSRVRCWTAPVLSDGRIFIRTNTGDLVCLDVSASRKGTPQDP